MKCYSSYLLCFNTETGKSFPLSCRSYNCDQHGKKNRGRLRRALIDYLEPWPIIRFWTFTLSSSTYQAQEIHLRDLNKVWRYFITELRRNRIMTIGQQGTQYIRFMEPHKSGYFHFHAVFDRYVPHHKIKALWSAAIETVIGLNGDRGGVHVKGIYSAKNSAFYIVKYVTKSSAVKPGRSRVWTKSNQVALFPRKLSTGSYAILNTITGEWYGLSLFPPLLETNITQLHVEASEFELFPGYFIPPEDKTYQFH